MEEIKVTRIKLDESKKVDERPMVIELNALDTNNILVNPRVRTFITVLSRYISIRLYYDIKDDVSKLVGRKALSGAICKSIKNASSGIIDRLVEKDGLDKNDITDLVFALTYCPLVLNIFNDEENRMLNFKLMEVLSEKI